MHSDSEMSSASPLITVIIPVFKAADKLPASLSSLLSSRAELWDVVIRDGSPDSAPAQAVVEEFLRENPSVKITYIGGPDKGVYDAMNQAIDRSVGKFIYFLGSGDLVEAEVFKNVAPVLQETEKLNELCVVYGNWLVQGMSEQFGHVFTWMDFSRKRNVSHQAMFFSKGIFKRLGSYELRYPTRADNVLNIKIWGDKAILKRYVPLVMTTFEGGGMSENIIDKPFHDDFEELVNNAFGLKGKLVARISDIKYRLTNKNKS